MATAPVLEATPQTDPLAPTPPVATDPLAPAAEPVAPPSDTAMSFEIEDYDKDIELDLINVPAAIRMRLLKSATKSYIINRVSTGVAKTKKENAKFDSYDAAMKNDPLQVVVAKPDGERAVTDYATIIDGAIKALYSGELGKRGTGEKKSKPLRSPLITQITRSVVAEVYEKQRAIDPQYKYPTAQKEVGQDGLEYLRSKIDAQVAALPPAEQDAKRTALNKYLETRYINPAKIMLGIDTPKTLKDAEGIL